MKKYLLVSLLNLIVAVVVAQNQTTTTPKPNQPANKTTPTKVHFDEFWISGSIGGGAVLSTNIINSGAVIPFRTEFLWQRKHRRLGFGLGNELEITP